MVRLEGILIALCCKKAKHGPSWETCDRFRPSNACRLGSKTTGASASQGAITLSKHGIARRRYSSVTVDAGRDAEKQN